VSERIVRKPYHPVERVASRLLRESRSREQKCNLPVACAVTLRADSLIRGDTFPVPKAPGAGLAAESPTAAVGGGSTGKGVRDVNGVPFVMITVAKSPTGWSVTITIGLM
jgi:hypothetical protein